MTLPLETIAAIDAALPLLVPDKSAREGSILVVSLDADPTMHLNPDLLAMFDAHGDDDQMVADQLLDLYKGKAVVLYRIGYHADLAFIHRACELAGATVLLARSLDVDTAKALFA